MKLVLLLKLLLFFLKVNANVRIQTEHNLINTVLSKHRYNKQVIPLVDEKTPVTVTFDMTFRSLINVDEKNQIVVLLMWVRQEWQDPMLSWDPKDHMNITMINIQNDLVWLPDICLYNTVDDSAIMGEKMDTSVEVDNFGNITWLSPYIFKSGCKIDVTYFPFDQQLCNLEFGSWTYDGDYMDIIIKDDKFDMGHYVENTEWRVIDVIVKRELAYYPCCTRPYPTLTYQFTMRRRTLFSLTNLVLPPLIIVLLAFLSFWLPIECGERISLVMTVLLSITVFLLYVSSFMPPTSEVVPLIGKFNLACMVIITICLLATFLTVKLHHMVTPIPNWLQFVVNQLLARILLIHKPPSLTNEGYQDISTNNNGRRDHINGTLKDTDFNQGCGTTQEDTEASALRERSPKEFANNCRSDLRIMAKRIQQNEADEIICAQWKQAARVLDRLFFMLCFPLFLIAVFVIFFN